MCFLFWSSLLLLSVRTGCSLGLEKFSRSHFGQGRVKLTFCNSVECEYELFMNPSDDEDSKNELLVYFPTVNVEYDPYPTHYLGVVLDLFGLCDNVHVVVSSFSHFLTKQFNSEQEFEQLRQWTLHNCSVDFVIPMSSVNSYDYCREFEAKLYQSGRFVTFSPRKIAIVSIIDPVISVDTSTLITRKIANLPVPILLHLNDEMPWKKSPTDIQNEILAYQSAFKVFRTVYYDAYKPYSIYIPVRSGALLTAKFMTPMAKMLLNYHTAESLAQVTIASERPVLCSFAGGLKYIHLGGNQRQDRVEMVNTFANFSHCDIITGGETFAENRALSKYEYIELMRGSVFVLCPTGLNPETQRPHQAMELGAIPLSLKVPDTYMDYLSEWTDYPGPVFNSWLEARGFIQAVVDGVISSEELDVLQDEIRTWYHNFLLNSRRAMNHTVFEFLHAQ